MLWQLLASQIAKKHHLGPRKGPVILGPINYRKTAKKIYNH